VKDIGKAEDKAAGSLRCRDDLHYCTLGSKGSMYIFLTVFIIIFSLFLALLIFALRLVVLSHDIDHAFERCGADLLTAVRRDNFDAFTESDRSLIHHRINDPSNPAVRQYLLEMFVMDLSSSLRCNVEPGYRVILKKEIASGAPVYWISDFRFIYGNNTGVVRAALEVPVVLFGNTIQVYEKELQYEFVLADK
jgi:hypothetical protein